MLHIQDAKHALISHLAMSYSTSRIAIPAKEEEDSI
jgi:hypothetical protein